MKLLTTFSFAMFISVFMNMADASATLLKDSSTTKTCKPYEPMVIDSCVTFVAPDIDKLVANAECEFDGRVFLCDTESIYYRVFETLYFPMTGEKVRRNKELRKDIDETDFDKEPALKDMRANGENFAKWLARNRCASK